LSQTNYMASRKDLKQLINSFCYDVIDDCLTLIELQKAGEEKIRPLLNDAIELRNDLMLRFGQARKAENPGAVYKAIYTDLENNTLEYIDRLNALV